MGQLCFKNDNGSSTERSQLLAQEQRQPATPKRKRWIHWRDLVKQLRTENQRLSNEIINLKTKINEQQQQIQQLEDSANETMEKQLYELEQTLRNEYEHLLEASQTDSNFKINNYEYEIQSLRRILSEFQEREMAMENTVAQLRKSMDQMRIIALQTVANAQRKDLSLDINLQTQSVSYEQESHRTK